MPMARLDPIIEKLFKESGHELLIETGGGVNMRTGSTVQPVLKQNLTSLQILGALAELVPVDQRANFPPEGFSSFSYTAPAGPVQVRLENAQGIVRVSVVPFAELPAPAAAGEEKFELASPVEMLEMAAQAASTAPVFAVEEDVPLELELPAVTAASIPVAPPTPVPAAAPAAPVQPPAPVAARPAARTAPVTPVPIPQGAPAPVAHAAPDLPPVAQVGPIPQPPVPASAPATRGPATIPPIPVTAAPAAPGPVTLPPVPAAPAPGPATIPPIPAAPAPARASGPVTLPPVPMAAAPGPATIPPAPVAPAPARASGPVTLPPVPVAPPAPAVQAVPAAPPAPAVPATPPVPAAPVAQAVPATPPVAAVPAVPATPAAPAVTPVPATPPPPATPPAPVAAAPAASLTPAPVVLPAAANGTASPTATPHLVAEDARDHRQEAEAQMLALMDAMLSRGASDLHLSSETVPHMRIDGDMVAVEEYGRISNERLKAMIFSVAPEKNRRQWEEIHDTDFAYKTSAARFRVNVFEDCNGIGAVLRQIPNTIRTAEEIGLTKHVLDLCFLSKGLVLVTGPTGSGKSTTLAALIDYVNRHREDHIITVEDPVEFVHKNKNCLVNQREVGVHTKSFKNALRAALREDPDVVLVGEMRDLETIATAIETAETGHLVFGTLHTNTAASTVDRIIDQFPADRQAQIRMMLSESLKAVIAQTLCKRVGGGRVAAQEVLLVTGSVSNLIREGKTFQIPSVMQTSRGQGMVTLNDALLDLVKRKVIEPTEALIKSVSRTELRAMLDRAGFKVDSPVEPTAPTK